MAVQHAMHREHEEQVAVPRHRTAARWISIGGLLLIIFGLAYLTYDNWQNDGFRKFVTDRFAAVIGLPCAGLFSLLVVAIFEATAGPIDLKVPGFHFKGAGGPIAMWVVCFLAIVLGIKTLY